MSDGQHLALGLVFVIILVRWLLPDTKGHSKLVDIIGAAFTSGGSTDPGASPPIGSFITGNSATGEPGLLSGGGLASVTAGEADPNPKQPTTFTPSATGTGTGGTHSSGFSLSGLLDPTGWFRGLFN